MNTKKLQLKKKQLKNLSLDSLVLPQNKIVRVGGGRKGKPWPETLDKSGTFIKVD